jgi:serine/threonine protein kinase
VLITTDPLVGRRIGQYEIVARLGGGGMGVVYKARDGRLGRTVALKFLPQQWSDDESAKQRFVREAQAASATDHPNICTVHDIASADDGRLFIVMAYYEGHTLKQRLESGPLPVDEALDIATQVAEGLAKAHAQGVIHRDIKPANLMLTDDGVRIVDFGLAKFADTLQLTVVGSTMGTAAYMSPEQVKGAETDARSDVWALGVVLYEMLAGHPPFRGAYAEAISYAIRHDSPAPLRSTLPGLPEDVEQLVFRALHKDPAVRFQNGRELARALRQVRGMSVPLDLRTQVVPVPAAAAIRRRRPWRRWLAVGALLALVAAGAAWWLLQPGPRLPVLVMPIADQTGSADLNPYQRALTESLLRELSDSANIRVISWSRMLQAVPGLEATNTELSSLKTASVLTAGSSVPIVVLTKLLYENQHFRVRVEVREAVTSTELRAYESEPVPSALPKDTAYDLIVEAARLIEEHFDDGWLRAGYSMTPSDARLRGSDAARAFEAGLSAYEEQEYGAAMASFRDAARRDPQSALVQAWLSRSALMMRADTDATEAGRRAQELLTVSTPDIDRRFVESVAAESRGDLTAAEAALTALARAFPDDARWMGELAALDDRRAESRAGWESAVRRYHGVLAIDGGLIRPQLELCRLYNRLQDATNAKKWGDQALQAYTTIGWRGGQALARFCLVDALRQGDDADLQRAQQHAQAALQLIEQAKLAYNLPRAHYYVGLVAGEQGRLADAITSWEQATTLAERAGNVILRPLVFNNLGVAYEGQARASVAAEAYRYSADGYEQLGDQRRAAQQQFNSAALRIRFGEDVSAAVKDVENALAVLRRVGDVQFQVNCLELMGDYHRLVGRFAVADRELTEALSLARQHDLRPRVARVTLALARLRFDQSRYADARAALKDVRVDQAPRLARETAIALARVETRLGNYAGAQALFAGLGDARSSDGQQLLAFIDEARGELAYESDRLMDARTYFERAAARWTDQFVDPAAVEARAYLGLLDALAGRIDTARTRLRSSLDRARAMEHVRLEALTRVFFAQTYLLAREPELALQLLAEAPEDARLGAEIRASLRYWRAQSLVALQRDGGAELTDARRLVDELRSTLPPETRDSFTARREVRLILGPRP